MTTPLVILAAGMGSRYGGLKQLDPVGPHGETLLDYSVADAVTAGFNEVIFIIRHEIEEAFHKHIGTTYQKRFPHLKITYAFQDLNDLPYGFSAPSTRVKPWGTAHALLAARTKVNEPFAVINADDYYGASGYQLLKKFLSIKNHGSYAMIGYALKNTLSEQGSVSRGICQKDSEDHLVNIIERTSIQKTATGIQAKEKTQLIPLTGEETVSLNFWGFMPDIFEYLEKKLCSFLKKNHSDLTAEFYLPSAISQLIEQNLVSVEILPSSDPWFGLTHPGDLPYVKEALAKVF